MLDLPEDLQAAQRQVRAFCLRHVEPAVLELEAGRALPYPIFRELGRALGMAEFAAARAGGAPDDGLLAILSWELTRSCAGVALAFGASLGLFAGAVLARGTPEQKICWARPVLACERIGAWALTEPGAGSDAFGAMRTRATRVSGGFELSGAKTFITNAPYADVFVVYARADEGSRDPDVRAFLVERGARGLTTGPAMRKMGMHASPTGEVFLEGVFVPEADVLGGAAADDARKAARASLAAERLGMTPMCLGIVERCLEEATRHARERTQWGRPIATFQLVQEKLAQMYVARSTMFTLFLRQLEALRSGVALSEAEASAQKLYCARTSTACALDAVQVLGGAGYMEGVVERMARDAKLFQIGGGTDEIQTLRIARALVEG
jgi:alkylation response protein AidB-like acyl-CoA dehydrogenase